MTENAIEIFISNWRVYQKITDYNYMHHEAFTDYLLNVLHKMSGNSSIAVLDIGCGDASQVCMALQQTNILFYKGYDLSGPALALATENLSAIDAQVVLMEGDMRTLLKAETGKFDVIHSSFAIHHLQDEEKQQLLNDCYQLLNGGGVLIYTDIFRTNGQTRPLYMAEYIFNIESSWDALSDDDKQLVYDHVSVHDFPALVADVEAWLTDAGFTIKQIYQPDKWHNMIVAFKTPNN